MNDYYYSQQCYQELVEVNENLVDLNENIETLNTSASTLLTFVIAIGVLISADILHHILDAIYKFRRG